jgi:hypothetical protein
MPTVNLAHAKAHPSELIDKIENGEEVVITRRGRYQIPPKTAHRISNGGGEDCLP